MARALALPCKYPGCANLNCKQHTGHRPDNRPNFRQRGYGTAWDKLRKMFLRANPVCVDPDNNHLGQIVPATDAHHKIAKKDGGEDSFENLMALCHSCHSKLEAKLRK